MPPGVPTGRPSVWQAALIFAALGLVAAGSCAAFLQQGPSAASSDLWANLFIVSVFPAAGAFVLLGFRLWRRRAREAWPSVAQAALIGVAASVLAAGGCGGFVMMSNASVLLPLAGALFVVFVVGLVVALGAGELFLISVFRLMFKRPGAR